VNEQRQNPYVDIKMTYRLDHLIERQAEFYLDFPIFVMGGVGTDFEFSLENVRQKVGARPSSPILLFGPKEYWSQKITSLFKCNLYSGTIRGSEWIGNTFFCVETAEQAFKVYDEYFRGVLSIGSQGPIIEQGFIDYSHLK
jgi:predicted Rossmann-fold nucleotide-binding protein